MAWRGGAGRGGAGRGRAGRGGAGRGGAGRGVQDQGPHLGFPLHAGHSDAEQHEDSDHPDDALVVDLVHHQHVVLLQPQK